jgi:zinc protease
MIDFRSIAPDFQIPEDIQLNNPQVKVLPNGIIMYFIPTPEIGAVKLDILADNLPGVAKKFVSFFTLHLLLDGTKTKSAEFLDGFFDTYASEVDVVSNFEKNGLSLLTTKKHLQTVLPVFRELLSEAIFPEKELSKRQSQKALQLSIQQEQNSAVASQNFRKHLFGTDHPYGYIPDEKDVYAITADDLRDHYQHNLWINPEIFINGNLNDSDLEIIAKLFGDLPVKKLEIQLPNFKNHSFPRIDLPKEKSVQSSLRIGCHLIPKQHPDYHALSMFNTILGGYFGSRLIKNIREEKGHTYGIYSSIGSLKNADYWVIMADVQKEYTEEVVKEIYLELKKLQEEPIQGEELEIVRNYLIGHFLSNFSNSFDLMSRFQSVHQLGLDFSYYQSQLNFIRNFSPELVSAIGKKYLNPEHMLEVIVG